MTLHWLQTHVVLNRKKALIGSLIAVLFLFSAIQTGASPKAILFFLILILGASLCNIKFTLSSPLLQTVFSGLLLFSVGLIDVFLTQTVNDCPFFQLPVPNILLGAVCCLIPILFLWILTLRLRLSIALGSGILLLLSIANFYVYSFRGNELIPADFLSLQTAFNVAEQYHLFLPNIMLYGIGVFFFLILLLYTIQITPAFPASKQKIKIRGILLLAESLLICLLVAGSSHITTSRFRNGGSWENGYILNFTLQIPETFVEKPDQYTASAVNDIADHYVDTTGEIALEDCPNIIAIMNESFADFYVLEEDFCSKYQILPFYHSLTENTIHGYALSSVFGGCTANSEYEFLTGNSMAFLPQGSIPYQQFIKENQYSIVNTLKGIGYRCFAFHPYYASGWNRPYVYESFGFSDFISLDDYPQKNILRTFVSDQEMYETLIQTYEEKSANEKLFLFGVTMQNHSDFLYEGDNFQNEEIISDYTQNYADANQYLTILKQSDHALQYLIEYFEQSSEKVVIVMFGDHYPRLDQNFYQETYGKTFDSLEEQMKLQKIPFFIWANFPIEEKTIECTSLNYLSNYVYSAAGIPLPAYNQFLAETETVLPAINAYGFYSQQQNAFLPLEEATGNEAEVLHRYHMVQYNSTFDPKHRNKLLFP